MISPYDIRSFIQIQCSSKFHLHISTRVTRSYRIFPNAVFVCPSQWDNMNTFTILDIELHLLYFEKKKKTKN